MVSDRLGLQWGSISFLKQSLLMQTKYVLVILDVSLHKLIENDHSQVGHVYTCCPSATSLTSVYIHLLSGLKHRLFPLLSFILVEQTHCYSWLKLSAMTSLPFISLANLLSLLNRTRFQELLPYEETKLSLKTTYRPLCILDLAHFQTEH